jgi:hypothetical protein
MVVGRIGIAFEVKIPNAYQGLSREGDVFLDDAGCEKRE